MKLKITFLVLLSQLCFSQTEKPIKGTVLFNNFPMANVDVVNFTTKTSTSTTSTGVFFISAKLGDTLLFISKEYEIKKIVITAAFLSPDNLLVSLTNKPQELKEVVVFKQPSIRLSKDARYEQGKLDELALAKSQERPENTSVYNGKTSGLDLIKIAGMIYRLFKKEKPAKKIASPKVVFNAIVTNNFESNFYTKTLHLKEEQTALFLEFCQADPKSSSFGTNSDRLSLLDFLLQKRKEFEKLE